MTLSGATTPGLSGPRSNGNEGVLHIPQIFKAKTSLSDGLMSYPGHSLRLSYPLSRDTVPDKYEWYFYVFLL